VPGEMNVVAITREGRAVFPTLGTEFHDGDTLYLSVHASAMDRVESVLGIS
jgi:trk system potassium uptake protein